MHILPLSLKITQSGVNFSEYSPAVGFPRLLKTLCVKLTFRHQRHLLLLTGVMSSSMISLLKETRRECCSSCLYLEAKIKSLFGLLSWRMSFWLLMWRIRIYARQWSAANTTNGIEWLYFLKNFIWQWFGDDTLVLDWKANFYIDWVHLTLLV